MAGDDYEVDLPVLAADLKVGENPGRHAVRKQVVPQTSKEPELARDGDGIAEVDLDSGMGIHPMPHERSPTTGAPAPSRQISASWSSVVLLGLTVGLVFVKCAVTLAR